MYELTVTTEFCAAHSLVIRGEREVLHGHNFRVVACVAGTEVDSDGLLCDFHLVEAVLKEVIEPLRVEFMRSCKSATSIASVG